MSSNASISSLDKSNSESIIKKEGKDFNDSINTEDKKISENEFFKKIKEVNEFKKTLEILELNEYINMPRICAIGNQSSGKTSLLTSIIGLEILPKGEGVVTRRPLELRLNKINSGKPYIVFDEEKKNIITDFSTIKDKINKLTNSICGDDKDIKDKPLIINIFSQTCPNLTIIDLPGISKIPVGNQPKNIEEITKEMSLRYIKDPYTIILCTIDVNQDISTSDGLYLSKQVDYQGERTIGVLTKVDLMDEGTNCKEILLNKIIPLNLGYIAVKNRSKLDLINNISIKEGLENEKLFFKNNEIYNKMDKKLIGNASLIEKLIKVYTNMFYKNIGDFVDSIYQHINRLENEILLIGNPLSQNLLEKNKYMINLIKKYCDTLFDILDGQNNKKGSNNDSIHSKKKQKITKLYDNFLIKFYSEDSSYIKFDENIPKDISFVELLSPNLEQIKNESLSLFNEIVDHIINLSKRVIHKVFKRFPKMENKITEIIKKKLNNEVQKTKDMIDQILNAELTYEFINDIDFLEKYDKEKIIKSHNKALLEQALNEYFKIILRNVRNIIPKTIQYKLIFYLKNNLFNILSEYLLNNQDILNDFQESKKYIKIRNELIKKKSDIQNLLKKVRASGIIPNPLLKYDKIEIKKQLLIIQKKERDILFKNSLKKLKEIRNEKNRTFRSEDIKDTLESICIISSQLKENIIEEKEKNPEKFIPIQEAIEKNDEKSPIFCLGLLAQILEDQGIMTVIEREEMKSEEEKELSIATLDFIANGMINKTKFDLHFDFGDERNVQLLLNKYEQNKFKELIKEKISKEFGISKDNLILTDPQRGSFKISLFQTDNFNNFSLAQLRDYCQRDRTLCKLKMIQEDLIFKACKLSKDILDPKGNRNRGWGRGEKRGGYPYFPPIGWIGYGLNVKGQYDGGNDDWLAYDGNKNEWAVAYHGVGNKVQKVAEAVNSIVKGDRVDNNGEKIFLIPGSGQAHSKHKNANKINSGDEYVGDGVYCSPFPKVMNKYAKKHQGYKMGLMLRVKPQRIRFCSCICQGEKSSYWVLNGKSDEMRPYRILLKKENGIDCNIL